MSPLLIPFMILMSALWLKNQLHYLHDSYLVLLSYLPYLLTVISLVLCIQFNLVRNLLSSMLLVLSYLVIQQFLQSSLADVQTHILYMLLAIFVPAILIFVSWLPERGVMNINGVGYSLAITLLLIAISYSYHSTQLLSDFPHLFPLRIWQWSILSPLNLLIFGLFISHQLARMIIFNQSFDAGLSVILVALAINFIYFDQSYISLVIFSAIQLIIIWSILKQSHDMAYRDELTGLPGRRALNEALKSPGRKYVMAMMDIDHFKKFNDKYGHDVGDDVLKAVASKMSKITGGGKVYRYGGEEFTVLFKGYEIETCIPHLEAVREDIANYKLSIREKKSRPKSSKVGKQKRATQKSKRGISVTISIGVAKKIPELNSPEEVLKSADKALYKAKKAGRNCLVSV